MRDNIIYSATLILSIGIIVSGGVYFKTKQIEAMRYNIENAIVKGIDPIAVKCAYGADDSTCIAYALRKSPDANFLENKSKK